MHGNITLEKNDWKVAEDETIIVDPEARKLQEQQERHNWKATGIALCAIVFVLLAVGTATLLLGTEDENEAFWQRVPYDLSAALEDESSLDIFVGNSSSSQQWKSTRWIADHQLVYWDSLGGLSIYHADTNRSSVLVPSVVLIQWRASEEYWPSYDGRYVLLKQRAGDSVLSPVAGEPKRGDGYYAVYDSLENQLWKVRLRADELSPTELSYAGWAGRSSHLLAIYQNRIYWNKDATSRAEWQLRGGDHRPDHDFVGLPDWTYSEGIARWKTMVWPSLDGQWLLYAVLDSSPCHRLDYIDYLPDRSAASSLRFAVPGGALPGIQLQLLHLENDTETTLPIGEIANRKEWLLVQVEWLDMTSFLTAWMTRNQNQTSVFHCPAITSKCTEIILAEAADNNHWLEPPRMTPAASGRGFLFVTGDTISLHRSPWEKTTAVDVEKLKVRRIAGWDEDSQLIYLLGSPSTSLHQRHLYRIRPESPAECLTCDFPADNCEYVDAHFEPWTAAYYELQCLGRHIPGSQIIRSEDGEVLVILRRMDADGDKRELLERLTPTVRNLDIPLADGSTGQAQLLLPKTWNDDLYHKLRFPLIIQTLDWDEDEALTDQWRQDWATYFTIARQVVYARIRGRERNTNEFGALRFGADDILTTIQFLIKTLRHIDEQGIIIMGKGVGGYLATMAMARDEEQLLKCGIIIAPTVDWLRQETTVAERLLGRFKDHSEHYVLMRLEDQVQHIRNDTLLLIDSIPFNPVQHFQLMRLYQYLVKAGSLFQHKVYPRSAKKMTQYHYYLSIEFFITQCLNGAK